MSKFKIGDTVRCVVNGTAFKPKANGYKPDKEFVVDFIRRHIDGDIYFPKDEHGVFERDLILVKNGNLIGRKVKGFKFKNEVIHYNNFMDKYIDQIGVIVSRGEYSSGYRIMFDNGQEYTYPSELIEKYLIEEYLPKTLPKSFACKNTNQELWDKYISWLNTTYNNKQNGTNKFYLYYGIDKYGETGCFCSKVNFDTILTLEEWDEIVNGTQIKTEEVMKKYTITRIQLKEIHDISCVSWKSKIQTYTLRNPFGNTFEFTQAEVNEMFKAATTRQKPFLEDIFGKQLEDIDLSKGTVDGNVLFDTTRNLTNALMCVRAGGKYENKAFILSDVYNWELVKDVNNNLCLVPTRK